jgi:hypothetical protein
LKGNLKILPKRRKKELDILKVLTQLIHQLMAQILKDGSLNMKEKLSRNYIKKRILLVEEIKGQLMSIPRKLSGISKQDNLLLLI